MADDLFEALKMFSQGVKEYQLQSAIGDANNYVQQIKAADLSEQQKRSELQSLSNQLVGHLAGIGASSAQIAAAAQSVGPKQFASGDQATLEGILTGNTDLTQLGMKADQDSTANQLKLYAAKSAIDEASQKRLFEHQERMASLRASNEKPSGDQFKAAGFAKRILDAQNTFNDLEAQGFNRADLTTAARSNLPNRLQGADLQKQTQAERNFVNAVLRRESGAAIAPSEFESAEKQYFPRSGDTEEVIAQKLQNRIDVLQSLKAESGTAWDRVLGTNAFSGSPAGARSSTTTQAPTWSKYLRR